MSSAAIPYGADELKRVAQRYWSLGFLISVSLHVSLVGALQLRWLSTDSFRIPTDVPHNSIVLDGPTHQMISGVVEPLIAPKETSLPRHKDGNPVPVKEELVPKDQTISSQAERVRDVSPGTSEGTEGTAVQRPVLIDEDNPPPFRFVEHLPEPVSSVPPVYPEAARRANLEGKVLVRMLVGKDGKVKKVVVEQTTLEILNDAACDAAMKAVFTPAYNAGGPVSVWMYTTFVFRLR